MEVPVRASEPSPETVGRFVEPVVTVTSLERGRGPATGAYRERYFWRDIMDGPPPGRLRRGEGSYVVYEAFDIDPDTRIKYLTIVSMDPGLDLDDPTDNVIQVDARIAVQNRVFLEAIHRERAFMARTAAHWTEMLNRRLADQRRVIAGWENPAARKAGDLAVRAQSRVGTWGIHAAKKASDVAVQVPDYAYARWLRVRLNLEGRLGRRSLWQGIKEPGQLTNEQKGVVLTLSLTLLAAFILILNSVISVFLPMFANAYQDLFWLFTWGVGTAVALPAPPFPPSELLTLYAYVTAGPVAVFATVLASKVVAAWLVFFIGDALHDWIDDATTGKPRMRRMVDWMHRNSKVYGLYVLMAFAAVPFLPDTLGLYVFAVSGMSFRHYMIAVAAGTTIRYAAIIGGIGLYGPEKVTTFLDQLSLQTLLGML